MRFIFLPFLLLIVFRSNGQNFQPVDSLLYAGLTQQKFNGTVLIAKQGKILFEKSYGFADMKTKKPFNSKTTFQIASVSKQFTAFGIMLLNSKGKLRYDDPVKKYLVDFPYKEITIRHLINHSSGLPDFWNGIRPHLDKNISNGNKEMFSYLVEKNLPLQNVPGTKWIYSDIGYDLLSMIIEKISGLSFQDFMKQFVFKPSRMLHTKALMVTDIRKIKEENQAPGHELIKNTSSIEYAHLLKKNDFVFYLGNFYGDGSVISTARDLFTWDQVISKNLLLNDSLFREAIQPAKILTNAAVHDTIKYLIPHYGFGWFLGDDPDLGKHFFHSGGHPGFSTYFSKFPAEEITIIYLNNLSSENQVQFRKAVIEKVLAVFRKEKNKIVIPGSALRN